MKKILIAYTTNAGSTAKVAQAIGKDLGRDGAQIQVSRLEQVTGLETYDAIVVGAPMILGWHGAAVKFIHKHEHTLSQMPVAYFLTAMSLTQTSDTSVGALPVYVDPGLAKPPKNPRRLSFKERYATVPHYLDPVFKAAPSVKPVGIGFFGGKLELYRLPWWQMLFVLLVIQAQPGDLRHWSAIREWTISLRPKLLGSELL